jgi:hypothetical protein
MMVGFLWHKRKSFQFKFIEFMASTGKVRSLRAVGNVSKIVKKSCKNRNKLSPSIWSIRHFLIILSILYQQQNNIFLFFLGIGVVLVTISGVAWRLTTADGSACFGMEGTEFDHCGRQQCLRNSMSHGLLYPEFQHRQPPPTYQASMQEYRLR